MKKLSKILILLIAGFVAGFQADSFLTITFRKNRTSEFLAEAEGQIKGLRVKVDAFHGTKGRFPRDVPEMVQGGFWSPERPPTERLRGCAKWVYAYDGLGGFVYLTATGKIYLNVDLKDDYLRFSDIHKLETGDLVPPGTFF